MSTKQKKDAAPVAGKVENSLLGDAIGFGGAGYPQGPGLYYSEQVSQSTTLFKNLRWYMVSNFRQLLSEAYIEIGLIQTIVDVPVDDGLRGGVEIKSKQLDEDQIELLRVTMDRSDDLNTAGQAAKWNRLFGGAGIMIITDQDPETPLDLEALEGEEVEFRAVDLWELFWDLQNTEGYDPVLQRTDFEFYSYYGERVHKSRVLPLKGMTAPSFLRPRLRGWGFSVVEALVRSINQYLKATDLGFEVLDEFKLDVYKIKNLTQTLLSPQGANKVRERVQLANWQKNYQNALILDVEDEFDHKQLSFSGLGEAMAGIRMQVASDMRMPLTKLFGISAAGFNSGEDDIEVYNAMVESQVRGKLKYHIVKLIEIRCQQLFGFIPDDLVVAFKPLRVLSAEQEENVKTQKFNRLIQAKSASELTTEEFRDACNKGNLFDVQLDTSDSALDALDEEAAENMGAAEGEDDEDGGANAPDSSTPVKPKKVSKQKSDLPPDAPSKPHKRKHTANVKNEFEKWPNTRTGLLFFDPYTALQRTRRALSNSVSFDRASYEADGGDAWIDPRRSLFFSRDKAHDKPLWDRAMEVSQQAFGEHRWQFVVWLYLKLGGRFQ